MTSSRSLKITTLLVHYRYYVTKKINNEIPRNKIKRLLYFRANNI
ncbi:hypothetical protein BN1088_1431833 [Sphingobacterium sp. PM2-P1-29]|nr:hypothetical protein BN1088_1431833 [Sphingobacterium sp. PM2-P1-29]